jgi:hypothetical protein
VNSCTRSFFVVGAVALLCAAQAFAFQTPEKPAGAQDTDPAKMKPLSEAVEGLDKALKEKSEVDVLHFAKLVGDHYAVGDKALQDTAVDRLGRALKSKNVEIKTTVIEALGKSGGKASAVLVSEIEGETAKNNSTYACKVVQGIGQLKEEKSIPVLLKLLHNKNDDVVAQAVLAFINYRDLKLEARKNVFKELMKNYAPLESAAQKSGAKTTDKQRYAKLSPSYENTLRALSNKQDVKGGAEEWDKWFRKEGEKATAW